MREVGDALEQVFREAVRLESTLPGGGLNAGLAGVLLLALAAEGTYYVFVNGIERLLPAFYFVVDRVFGFLHALFRRPYEYSDAHTRRRTFARPPKWTFWTLPGFLAFSMITIAIYSAEA